jgi:hypothetical protein
MQEGTVAAWTAHALAIETHLVVRLKSRVRRREYVKGQESCGMPRKHPDLFSLSVPPHKR